MLFHCGLGDGASDAEASTLGTNSKVYCDSTSAATGQLCAGSVRGSIVGECEGRTRPREHVKSGLGRRVGVSDLRISALPMKAPFQEAWLVLQVPGSRQRVGRLSIPRRE
jgi:hypothetical protein